MYVLKRVQRAYYGGAVGSLHKEMCNCGTIPFINGPKAGCPGPTYIEPEPIAFEARVGSRCPGCREPRMERARSGGGYRCGIEYAEDGTVMINRRTPVDLWYHGDHGRR
jgi:hypothetical protein